MQMFGSVVLGVQYSRLARELDRVRGDREEADLTVEELQLVVERLKGVIDSAGKTFPEDVNEQLRLAMAGKTRQEWACERESVCPQLRQMGHAAWELSAAKAQRWQSVWMVFCEAAAPQVACSGPPQSAS